MHAREPLALRGREDEAGIAHPERSEDVLSEVRLESLAAQPLDQLADPVEVDAVLPAFAGVEHQRHLQGNELGAADGRYAGRALIPQQIRVPRVVAKARGMRQQVAQGDGSSWRTQAWRAAVVKPFEHLDVGELGQPSDERFVERDTPLLDQLHGPPRW